MCGGSGTRLWPASRESFPKQFIPLAEAHRSSFQATAARVTSASERLPRLADEGAPWIQESRSLAYALQADHPFRSGVVVSPSLTFSRTGAAAPLTVS